MSAIVSGEVSANLSAVEIFLELCCSFLPPFLPLALAATNPALVLSRIICRSNSAIAPKMLKTNLPPLVVVSIASVRLTNPIPLVLKSSTSVSKCLRERPSRSSRQTTKVSPLRSWSRHLSSPGLDSLAPETVSLKIFSHPAFFRASFYKFKVWSLDETRQYPIFIKNVS